MVAACRACELVVAGQVRESVAARWPAGQWEPGGLRVGGSQVAYESAARWPAGQWQPGGLRASSSWVGLRVGGSQVACEYCWPRLLASTCCCSAGCKEAGLDVTRLLMLM